MAIVNCKNPDLYRRWLDYFRRTGGKPEGDILTAVERTEAFFASQRGEPPPLFM